MEKISTLIIIALILYILLQIKKMSRRRNKRNSYYKKPFFRDYYNQDPYQNNYQYQESYQQQYQQPEPEVNKAPEHEDKKEEPYDYSYMPYQKRMLLTKTEYAFYVVLMKECNKRKLLVCPKVRLEDIVYVTDKEHPLKYRGYVKARHVDFIVTDIRLNTLAGIELDDPSHNNFKAAKTDRFKTELFKTINVPLIRIKTGTEYATQLAVVFDQLNLNTNTTMTKNAP